MKRELGSGRGIIRLQAAVLPAVHGKWEVKFQVPTPRPATNQVLIKIHASGLCYTDIHITASLLPSASFPRTIGHEPVGEIVEVGDGVSKRIMSAFNNCSL